MSPNPIWNVVLMTLGMFMFVFPFILMPIAYLLLCRPLDKQFKMKHYTIEKGIWFFSVGVRTASYAMGILLEPYRNKKLKSKLISEVVRRRFIYQDKTWGKNVNFRDNATKLQIILSVMIWLGGFILFCTVILVAVHNFIIYPEIGWDRAASH